MVNIRLRLIAASRGLVRPDRAMPGRVPRHNSPPWGVVLNGGTFGRVVDRSHSGLVDSGRVIAASLDRGVVGGGRSYVVRVVGGSWGVDVPSCVHNWGGSSVGTWVALIGGWLVEVEAGVETRVLAGLGEALIEAVLGLLRSDWARGASHLPGHPRAGRFQRQRSLSPIGHEVGDLVIRRQLGLNLVEIGSVLGVELQHGLDGAHQQIIVSLMLVRKRLLMGLEVLQMQRAILIVNILNILGIPELQNRQTKPPHIILVSISRRGQFLILNVLVLLGAREVTLPTHNTLDLVVLRVGKLRKILDQLVLRRAVHSNRIGRNGAVVDAVALEMSASTNSVVQHVGELLVREGFAFTLFAARLVPRVRGWELEEEFHPVEDRAELLLPAG